MNASTYSPHRSQNLMSPCCDANAPTNSLDQSPRPFPGGGQHRDRYPEEFDAELHELAVANAPPLNATGPTLGLSGRRCNGGAPVGELRVPGDVGAGADFGFVSGDQYAVGDRHQVALDVVRAIRAGSSYAASVCSGRYPEAPRWAMTPVAATSLRTDQARRRQEHPGRNVLECPVSRIRSPQRLRRWLSPEGQTSSTAASWAVCCPNVPRRHGVRRSSGDH